METVVILRNLETGEIMCVADPEGYAETEWEVLGIDRVPNESEVWDETAKTWVLDQTLVVARDEEAEIRDMTRLRRFVRRAKQRIADLEQRVSALEGN